MLSLQRFYYKMRKLLNLIIIILLTACSSHETARQQLSAVDSLVQEGLLDSAQTMLTKINSNLLNDKEDRAYFDLLSTIVGYRLYEPVTTDSVIDSCVDFYRQFGDNRKLCEAFYYQGMIKHLLGKTNEAIVCLKQAEQKARESDDMQLKHKICYGLLILNYSTANYDLALDYARRELFYSEQSGNKDWIAHAYNHLSCAYAKIGENDSAIYYIKKVLPYIPFVPVETQSYHLSNIGLYYLQVADTVKAKGYLVQSYKAKPIPETSNLLASIFIAEGKPDSAYAVWNTALEQCGLEGRLKIRESMAGQLYKIGHYKEADLAMTEIKSIKDSLANLQQTNKVQRLQLDYDHNIALEKMERTIRYCLIGLVALVFVVIAAIMYYRHRAKKQGYSMKLLIDDYKQRISQLEASGKSMSQEMDELRQKLSDAEERKIDELVAGRLLYESIQRGETTGRWNKADFSNFIAYYRVVNPAIFDYFSSRFSNLSAGNMFLLILQDIGYDNDNIRRILHFSPSALRVARFRIKNKMK